MKSAGYLRLTITLAIAVCLGLATLAVEPAFAEDGSGISSLGGTLKSLGIDTALGAAEQVEGAVGASAEAANSTMNVLDAAHSIMIAWGHRVELDFQYEPMDIPQGIHLRENPKADRSSKRIRLDAYVTFSEDYEQQIPAAAVRKFFGMDFPPKGPVSDKTVRWEFSPGLLKYVEVPTRYFDAYQPTWIKRTDAKGVATVYLYPILDQPLGGIRKAEEAFVQADVPTTAGKGFTTNLFTVAVGLVSDELTKPVSTMRSVQIERHIPTEWRARVTAERKIECSWNKAAPPPTQGGESRTVQETGTTTWTEKLIINDAFLDTAGVGSGDYDYGISARAKGKSVVKTLGACGSGTRMFTTRKEYSMTGEGQETDGETLVAIRVDPTKDQPLYAVQVATRVVGNFAQGLGFREEGTISGSEETCEGTKSIPPEKATFEVVPGAKVAGSLVMRNREYLVSDWKPFDPDARVISGTITWTDALPESPDGALSYQVTTTMSWELQRVFNLHELEP